MYLCVLCGSQYKQRLFPYTALTDQFIITETESVYCAVRNEIQVSRLLPLMSLAFIYILLSPEGKEVEVWETLKFRRCRALGSTIHISLGLEGLMYNVTQPYS